MNSIKLKIKSCSDSELMSKYISAYTHAFYKLYNSPDLITDSTFLKSLQNEFICAHMIGCLVSDVKSKLDADLAQKEVKITQLADIEKQLKNKKFVTNKELKIKFKLIQKSIYLKNTIGKRASFGSKKLQRDITKLSQIIQQQQLTDTQLVEKQLLLDKYKSEYKLKRKIPLYLIGDTNRKGNRLINFNLINLSITYKPNRSAKVKIDFYCGKNQKKILSRLQESILTNPQPITVTINSEYIIITYDESKLNGTAFDLVEVNRLRKKANSEIEKKEIYKRKILQKACFDSIKEDRR